MNYETFILNSKRKKNDTHNHGYGFIFNETSSTISGILYQKAIHIVINE